jgi:serine/threonine-protein kinase
VARGRPLEAAWQPRKLGRYWLLDAIASSRIGGVYQALLRVAGKPDRLLAIKRISAELSRDQLFSALFLDVMARVSELKHPASCPILNCGRADGSLCVVMEWVPGKDLAQIAVELRERGEAMPPRLVAYVGSQIADALATAHVMTRAGQPAPLYHGDLALTNILIGYDGRVRLTGLGSSEIQAAAPSIAGSHGYRAPELAQGSACDARSDVFALGASLYEVLVGEPPAIARSGATASRKPESSIRRLIPRPLEQVVSRALMEQPDARWQSAAEMARALEPLSNDDGELAGPKTLGSFMRALYDAGIKGEQLRLDALLSRVASATASETGVHRVSSEMLVASTPPAPQPSSSAAPARVTSRPPPQPPSVRPPPPKRRAQEARVDLADLTPPRGYLMEQLAAEMHDQNREAPAAASSQAPLASAPQSFAAAPAHSPPLLPLPGPQRPARSSSMKLALGMALATLVALGASLWRGNSDASSPSAGSLVVRTHPAGAEVFVHGRRVGTTPLPSTELGSGPVVVELRARGFETVTRTVELQAGKLIELDLDLRKREAAIVSAPPASAVVPASEEVAVSRETQSRRERRRRTAGSRTSSDDDLAQAEAEAEAGSDEQPATEQNEPAIALATTPPPAPQPEIAAVAPQLPAPAPVPPSAPAAAPRAAAPATPRPRASEPIASRGVTRDAVLLERAQPKFPPRAKRLDVYEGVVLIEFTIDRAGKVREPKVVQATPAKVFEETALSAIQKFKFRPKTVDDVPVESRSRFTFRFQEEN